MTATYRQGLSLSGLLPSFYNDPEALEMIRTPNIFFTDNYEKLFKRYGYSRHEMMLVIPYFMRVDPLSGTDILRYIE